MADRHKFRAALVQMTSGENVEDNLNMAESLIRQAAKNGAEYIQTPENTALMVLKTKLLFENIEPEDDNKALMFFMQLAKELKIWLHIGGMAVLVHSEKAVNRSYIIGPDGSISARYDKIHMFDVTLPNGEHYRESKNFQAGDKAVVCDLPWGKIGLTICYDLRFPYLYRKLAHQEAQILAVPAAFTVPTGQAHWAALLRARAIETGSFVLAAAQGGDHETGRSTYGHSMIISPWGEIIAESGVAPCCIYADINIEDVVKVRETLPSLQHDRHII